MPQLKICPKEYIRARPKRAAGRYKTHDELVVRELMKLWELLNYSCDKRLVAIVPELVAKLECVQDRGNVAGT